MHIHKYNYTYSLFSRPEDKVASSVGFLTAEVLTFSFPKTSYCFSLFMPWKIKSEEVASVV